MNGKVCTTASANITQLTHRWKTISWSWLIRVNSVIGFSLAPSMKRQARNAHPARPRCKRWAVAEGQRLRVGPVVGLWAQCHGEEEDDTCGTEEEDAEGGREPAEKVDFPGLVGEVAEAGLGAAVEGRALQGSRGEEREGGGEGKEDDGRHQEGDRGEAKAMVGFIPGRG